MEPWKRAARNSACPPLVFAIRALYVYIAPFRNERRDAAAIMLLATQFASRDTLSCVIKYRIE